MSNTLLEHAATDMGHEDTLLSSGSTHEAPLGTPSGAPRNTVLPRVEWKGAQPAVLPFARERFEEVRPLGQGGMGEVVLLQDHDIDRQVALKRMHPGADMDRVLRFVEEIRIVGQLDHPNIVPLHDVGVDERGRYFFVMKHLEGETLESIIARLRRGDPDAHARFPYTMRMQIFLGVLNAVSYAHRKGFIHRDLKPANIMVGPFGEVTVLDWGLARRVRSGSESAPPPLPVAMRHAAPPALPSPETTSPHTQQGTVMGTPLYMSPEQARGSHATMDVRSDIYSLSVVFHEFLCLRHYLEGRKTLEDIFKGVESVLPSMQDLHRTTNQPPVPAELAWFVMKGFYKDPAQRYGSVEEMVTSLQGVLDGRIQVHCQRTLLKNGLHRMLRVVDAHPVLVVLVTGALFSLGLASAVNLGMSLFTALFR
ncbi:serine/threonine protein kinase [Corallococcus sp. H22C18031201]|nr:serine/threonine protein kinase [Corallococcus sp. H22C18031201]